MSLELDPTPVATQFDDALSHISDYRIICMMEKSQAINKVKKGICELLHLKKRKIEIEIMKLALANMNASNKNIFKIFKRKFITLQRICFHLHLNLWELCNYLLTHFELLLSIQ